MKPSCTPLPRLDTSIASGSIDVESTEYALDGNKLLPLTVYAARTIPLLNEATLGNHVVARVVDRPRADYVRGRQAGPRVTAKSMMPALVPDAVFRPPT